MLKIFCLLIEYVLKIVLKSTVPKTKSMYIVLHEKHIVLQATRMASGSFSPGKHRAAGVCSGDPGHKTTAFPLNYILCRLCLQR
jgi:hypothetical protein